MFCQKCGASIGEDQAYCPNCGNKVNDVYTADSFGAAPIAARGGLKVWLWIIIIANAITLVSAVVSVSVLAAIFAAINIFAATRLLKAYKYGFYLICAITVITFIYNLALGVGIGYAVWGFVGLLIIWLLAKGQWKNFR